MWHDLLQAAVSRLIFVCLFLTGAITTHSWASSELPPARIAVSPARMELTIANKTTNGSATVINLSNSPVHIQTDVVSFDLDEENNFRELEPQSGSLVQAMMINPVSFTIAANSSQTVRFAIMPERLQGKGEHRAMLFFSELVDTNEPSVRLRFRLGVPVYAQRGDVDLSATVHGVALNESNQLSLDVAATGNAQVRPEGYYQWWPSSAYPGDRNAHRQVRRLADRGAVSEQEKANGGKINTKPVFPNTRRIVTAELEPPSEPGDYLLSVYVQTGTERLAQTLKMRYLVP